MEYVTLKWVADNFAPSAYAWAKQGRIEVREVKGEKCVSREVAEKLQADLKRTCSLAEASRLIGISKGSMRHMIDCVGVLKTMDVAGHERALRSSIGPAKKYVACRPERVREANKKAASSPRARLMNLLRGDFGDFVTRSFDSLQVFMPRVEARHTLGVSYGVFNRLCREGKLRTTNLRGIQYVEAASMKSLRDKTLQQMKKLKISL